MTHTVLITGAAGNLGRKLIAAFAPAPWCERIVAVDRAEAIHAVPVPSGKVVPTALDLTAPDPADLASALAGVDTILHFAVVNPMPDATWAESAASVEMTARLLLAARDAGLRRFAFASSNHAVGALKERDPFPAGTLTTDLVAPGTRWRVGGVALEGTAYGASKALTERLCLAAAQPGALTTVSVRIGWCQPGENRPATLNAGGLPEPEPGAPPLQSADRDLTWFRSMWLSNRDFVSLFERVVLADESHWPAPGIVVNGMSANAGMPWDIGPTRRWLGYEPRDDVWSEL